MIIFNSLEKTNINEKTAVALGNFDGIHMGHRKLIERAVDYSKEKGMKSAVFTFSNHPKNVLAHKCVVKNIIYEDEKTEILERLGVDYLMNFSFDSKMMKQSPEEFVKDLLVGRFNAGAAICGFNFTYGHKAGGNAETLMLEGKKYGFEVAVVPAVTLVLNGTEETVSSTLIREKISRGSIDEAAVLLGRSYTIRGIVIRGNQIGRTIGFPTCNISVDETMVTPSNGVYITNYHINGEKYPSVTNVGNKPTIGDYSKSIETHILNFTGNIYDMPVTIEFLKMIREERKFAGIDELRSQLNEDRRIAFMYHG